MSLKDRVTELEAQNELLANCVAQLSVKHFTGHMDSDESKEFYSHLANIAHFDMKRGETAVSKEGLENLRRAICLLPNDDLHKALTNENIDELNDTLRAVKEALHVMDGEIESIKEFVEMEDEPEEGEKFEIKMSIVADSEKEAREICERISNDIMKKGRFGFFEK